MSRWPGTPHFVFLVQLSARRIWILPFTAINRPLCVVSCARVLCMDSPVHACGFWHGLEQLITPLITGQDQRDVFRLRTPPLLFLLMLTVMGKRTDTHVDPHWTRACAVDRSFVLPIHNVKMGLGILPWFRWYLIFKSFQSRFYIHSLTNSMMVILHLKRWASGNRSSNPVSSAVSRE